MLTDTRVWLRPSIVIVVAITLLRWVLLAFDRTDLYVDESQYWLWGQEFAFGYYSKPPLIAWVIAAVTTLAGSDVPFWVRMPGAALHGLTALILAALTARIYGARLAVWVAVGYATLPMVAVGSLLMSTDTVMAPCFAAALYFHRRLIETPTARFAALAGGFVGLAFMAKYVAVYFLVGVALAAVLRKDQRISWQHAGIMLGVFAAVISPNIAWNLSHQFTTLAHTADNVGWVRNENPLATLNAAGLAEFFVSQFAVIGPILFAALLLAMARPKDHLAMAAFAIPALVVVCAQALLDKAYANWAVAAYFTGVILAIKTLEHRPRLRAASFAINGAFCLLLPVLVVFPTLQLNDAPLLARQLGRADLSRQIMALSAKAGDIPIYADNRDVLADLFYTGRNAGLTIYAPRPKARARNHYEQRYPLPKGLTGQVLVVSSMAPDCSQPLNPIALHTIGGAYEGHGLAAYLVDAGCLHAAD